MEQSVPAAAPSPFAPAPGRHVFQLGPNQRVVVMQPIADDPSFLVAGVFRGDRLVRIVEDPVRLRALMALCLARMDDEALGPKPTPRAASSKATKSRTARRSREA